MGVHRTAMGRAVDMSALQAKNEKVRAVGNMGVNARGDTIDSNGRVIVPVTSKVNTNYEQTVDSRDKSKRGVVNLPSIKPDAPSMPVAKPAEPVEPMELTEAEKAMEAEFDDDDLTEQIKKLEIEQQQKKGKK